jgi:tetrahydromethanopterin S-methyltransferase subunit G
MTTGIPTGSLAVMVEKGKPGRRVGTPAEYQDVVKLRLKRARGKREYAFAEMARLLTDKIGREISADTYRQWESKWTLPLDAILPVCDITSTHFYEFLGPITEQEREELKKTRRPEAINKTRLAKAERLES